MNSVQPAPDVHHAALLAEMEGIITSEELSPSPVRRLDLDTLTSIFYQVVHEPFNTQQAFKRLLCLTHICRRWRTLGLGLAELWGDVAFVKAQNSEMFNILLSRAKDAPLSCPTPPAYPVQVTDAFKEQVAYTLSHPEYFRRIWHATSIRCDWATALSGKALPDLEFAALTSPTPSLNLDHAPMQAPSLRTLNFDGFCMPFEAPRLSTLRVTLKPSPPLTFEFAYLREVLESVPNLIELSLYECLPIDVRASDMEGPIELPKLRHLSLRGPSLSIWRFLRYLRLGDPSSAFIYLDIGSLSNDADVRHLTRALKPYFSRTSRNTVRLRPDGFYCLETCVLPSLDRSRDEVGLIVLTLDNPANSDTQQTLLANLYESLFQQFSDDQVEHLAMTFSPNSANRSNLYPSIASAVMVPQLNKSVHTVIYHIDTSDYPDHTAMDFDIVPQFLLREQESPVYAKLEKLVFRASESVYTSFVINTQRPLVQLREWLDYRIQLGKPLRTLTLEGEMYTSDPTGTERIAVDSTMWGPIREVVEVVDQRKLLTRPPGA